ncbi:hypothetical protein [Rhodobacter lacus]|uniref:Uncharacterized protein n=1 Tax=Rhodobacter lacus TaxID=1641972 RepID=A0ABW5ACA0_9RHOB
MNAQKNPNVGIWQRLAPVDRKFTKPITGKSYRGDSPNPTYIILKVTEQFGPIGDRWGFEVKFDRIRLGRPHQVAVERHEEYGPPGENGAQAIITKTVRYEIIREEYHEVCITFWFRNEKGEIGKFDAFGGTPMLYLTKKGDWMHDEDAAKKSLTDAYTKGASWLGACADIFLGLFDDKYTSQPHNSAAANDAPPPEGQQSQSQDSVTGGQDPKQPQQQQRKTTTPSGW